MKTFSKTPSAFEKKREVPCNFCGSKKKIFLYTADGVDYVRCGKCGLVYQNPMPDKAALLARYDNQYYEYEIENEVQFFALMKLALGDVGFNIIAEGLPREKSFLDVGCATGMLLEYLSKTGEWETEGVEVCEQAVRHGRERRGLKIFNGVLEEAGFKDESFHVVHASHVIEHVTDPKLFVTEMYRICKPGGYCILTTPNIAGMQSRIFREKWRSAIADHLYLFSKKNLVKYMESTGFTVTKLKTWGGIPRGMAGKNVKRIADTLAKKLGIGDVMVVLGRK